MIHVIHGGKAERLPLLKEQMKEQDIDYFVWNGVHDTKSIVNSISLSHKQIVAYAKEKNLREITIAEDDIKFTHPKAYGHYLYNFPSDYDLYLGGIYMGDIDRNNITTDFCALHLYTIHKRFYDTFLSLPAGEHIDRALAGKGKYVVCNPFAAVQHNGLVSSNTGKAEDYDSLLKGYNLFLG